MKTSRTLAGFFRGADGSGQGQIFILGISWDAGCRAAGDLLTLTAWEASTSRENPPSGAAG
jgi:hypothetical protein